MAADGECSQNGDGEF